MVCIFIFVNFIFFVWPLWVGVALQDIIHVCENIRMHNIIKQAPVRANAHTHTHMGTHTLTLSPTHIQTHTHTRTRRHIHTNIQIHIHVPHNPHLGFLSHILVRVCFPCVCSPTAFDCSLTACTCTRSCTEGGGGWGGGWSQNGALQLWKTFIPTR